MSLQKIATIVSSLTAFLLIIIKLITWIFTSSIAIISSAIDSILDLFVSLFNFFAIREREKPATKKFNYWKWKIESLATLFEWVIITLSWFYVFYEAIVRIIHWYEIKHIGVAFIIMIISIIITWVLVLFLNFVGKKTKNIIIKADLLHYKTDLYTNFWIVLWIGLIYLTWIHYIDSIIWIIIALYIIYLAFWLIKESICLLLDVSLPKDEVTQIINILKSNKDINDFHFLKTRQSWSCKFIDVHLVFNPSIKLIDAHRVSDQIEEQIRKIDTSMKWFFNIHLDPYDDSNLDENKCNTFFDKNLNK